MQKKVFKIKNIILFISLLFVLVFIQYGVYVFAKYNIPIYEDTEYGLIHLNKITEQFFTNVYHGRFISNAITCILGSILPKLLNIHPIAFYQYVAPFIKGGFLFILFSQICGFLYRNKQKDFFLPVLIFFLYIQYQYIFQYRYQDVEYSSFYGFIFPFIFFNLFWNKFITSLEKDLISKKDKILLVLYAFLCGISTEFTNIVTFISLFIIFCFNKRLLKIYFYPFFVMITGMLLYYTNPGFIKILNEHPPLFFNLNREFFIHLKPFLFSVFDVIIKEYLFFLFFITVLLFLIIKKYGKKEKNSIIISLSLLFGGLLFSFFLMENPELTPDKNYYTYHFDLVIQYKILFIILIFYLLNCLKLNIVNEKLLLFIIMLFTVKYELNITNNTFLTEIFTFGYPIKKDSSEYKNCTERYIYEKINLWYMKNKGKIISIQNKPNQCYFRSGENETIYMLYVFNLNKKNYNIIHFNNIEEAYNQYLKDGGTEIENKEILNCNFQSLLIQEN